MLAQCLISIEKRSYEPLALMLTCALTTFELILNIRMVSSAIDSTFGTIKTVPKFPRQSFSRAMTLRDPFWIVEAHRSHSDRCCESVRY